MFDLRLKYSLPTLILAVCVSTTAMAMAAIAAFERGGTTEEKAVWVAISVLCVAALHYLPTLPGRCIVTWVIWVICLLCAIHGHFSFLTYSSQHAGEARARISSETVGIRQEIDTVRRVLDGIKARPLAIVAADMASTTDWRIRSAWRVELAEAKRAAELNDRLMLLQENARSVLAARSNDAVTVLLSQWTGLSQNTIYAATFLCFSLLLEFLGVLLWLKTPRHSTNLSDVGSDLSTACIDSELEALRHAVKNGNCKANVRSVQKYMGCSTQHAVKLMAGIDKDLAGIQSSQKDAK